MKYLTLLFVLYLSSCNNSHPNLESDTIVWDKEAREVFDLTKKMNFEDVVISGLPENIKKKEVISDYQTDLKYALIDSLKSRNHLFIEGSSIFVYTRNKTIIEIAISKYVYEATEFQTNKLIKTKDELLLTSAYFGIARQNALANKIWKFRDDDTFIYKDTEYSQFKFFNIKDVQINDKTSNSEILKRL